MIIATGIIQVGVNLFIDSDTHVLRYTCIVCCDTIALHCVRVL